MKQCNKHFGGFGADYSLYREAISLVLSSFGRQDQSQTVVTALRRWNRITSALSLRPFRYVTSHLHTQ